MQLDAEEDGPPFGQQAPPAGVVASTPERQSSEHERPTTAESRDDDLDGTTVVDE